MSHDGDKFSAMDIESYIVQHLAVDRAVDAVVQTIGLAQVFYPDQRLGGRSGLD